MNTSTRKRPLTASQRKALAAIPDLKDSAFPQVRGSIAAQTYIDHARFEAEKEKVFRRSAVIIGPSAVLPEPRSYFQQEYLGTPVLVTRAADGQVHAFVNVCRHRGALLCPDKDPVKGARLICRYHAWTYNLDGTLVGIPRQETFPGIDKKDHSLTRLPCVEAGGFIWAGLDPTREVDFSCVRGAVEEDLNALDLGSMTVFDRVTFPIQANWKLVMDTMLDSYHVTRLHKDSVARFFVDAENIVDLIGPHIRAAAARGNFQKSIVCNDFEDARQIMVFAYTLFPNGIVVCSPDFVSVGVLRPIAVDRSAVDYYMLINEPPADEKMQNKLRRSFDLMHQTFGQEDYWAAELCDKGLRTGTLKEVQLGGMEIQISMFHSIVEQRLAAD